MGFADKIRTQSTEQTHAQCDGRSWAYTVQRYRSQPHPAGKLHAQCPHCGALLGCSRCAGPWVEVVCTRCVAYVSIEGFAAHGPILDTPVMRTRRGGASARPLSAYPLAWQAAYRAALAESDSPPPAAVDAMAQRFDATDEPPEDAPGWWESAP